MEVALGLDIGTGSTKAGLVDRDGRLLAVGRSSHPPVEPRPGWSEADPRVWLSAAREALEAALAAVPAGPGRAGTVEIRAIGFSGQMHGVVVCGGDLAPLRPAVLWSDRRSEQALAGLAERLGPDLLARLANPLVAGMAGTTLAALRDLEPELFDGGRVRAVLQPKDWLRAQLTGRVATEPSDASATLLWDLRADGWSTEAAAVLGVPSDWLPPVVDSSSRAGELTGTGASALGLEPGIPVGAGAADTAAALLGAAVAVGETQLSTGTGGQLARVLDRPVTDRSRRTHLYRTAAAGCDGGWYAMAAIQNAGVAIDWALRLLQVGPDEVEPAMASVAPGADGVTFLPYLTGERTPHLDATLTGGWSGLRPTTSREALIRSVFEGVAFALRDGLEALRQAGHTVDRALLAGGGSVAPWWRQLLADALEIPLVPHDAADASVRGAALLGWASIGVDIDAGAMVGRLDVVEPSARGVAALGPARSRFRAAGPVGWSGP